VKVNVDVSGDVSSANLVSPGSSAYFAKLALQSARKWEFAPANKSGQTPSSTWILTFEFRKSGTRAAARQAK
jgi:TonB family protein